MEQHTAQEVFGNGSEAFQPDPEWYRELEDEDLPDTPGYTEQTRRCGCKALRNTQGNVIQRSSCEQHRIHYGGPRP